MGKLTLIYKFICFFKKPKNERKIAVRKYIIMPILRTQYGNIGKGSVILKELLVNGQKNIYIGNNVFIRDGARIEAVTEWNEKKYSPRIIIGDNVNIEQNLHLTCADEVVIGDNVSILSNVLITDINHSNKKMRVHPLKQDLEVSKVRIGSYSLIGSGAKILPGVNIGENCVVGANSVVTKNIPDKCIVVGVPAKIIKRYDEINKKWIVER